MNYVDYVPYTFNVHFCFLQKILDGLSEKGHVPTLRQPNRWFGGAMVIINACGYPCKDEADATLTFEDKSRPKTCELFCLHVVKDRRSGEDARSSENPVYYY